MCVRIDESEEYNTKECILKDNPSIRRQVLMRQVIGTILNRYWPASLSIFQLMPHVPVP